MKSWKHVLPLVSIILVVALTAEQTVSAADQFRSLQEKLQRSRLSNDWLAGMTAANELKELLNDSPQSLIEAARASVRVGKLGAALREVEQFVRMGQSSDLLQTMPDLEPLRKKADFAAILSRMKSNRALIAKAATAIRLSDPDFLAEDVDFDANSKRFFVTSVRERKIVALDVSGFSSQFAEAPDRWPMLAVKIDATRGVLWATEVALRNFSFVLESDWGRSAVLCYDLKNGKLLRRIEGPPGSALGDMALASNGDAIVSDGEGGGVYRVLARGSKLERLDRGDFISPQTPAMHPDGKHIFVPDYVRGIGLLEVGTKRVRWLSTEGRFALDGIDGLYFQHGMLVAVQNGTSPERVVAFSLDAALRRIKSETIIERSTSTLGDPTHGTIIGHDFYYIANSGWDVVDDHGKVKPGATTSEPRIMRGHLDGL